MNDGYAVDMEVPMESIQQLAAQARQMEDTIAQLEEAAKREKDRLRDMLENNLPMRMAEAGVSSFTMADGTVVKIEQKVYASFPNSEKAPERAAAASEWLRANGHGALLKQTVAVEFRDDDAEAAETLLAELEDKYGEGLPKLKTAVHPQTLAAFVREQLRENKDVPLETLGAHVVVQATLKRITAAK